MAADEPAVADGAYAQVSDGAGEQEQPKNALAVNREHDDGSGTNAKIAMIVNSALGQGFGVWLCLGGASTVGGWFGTAWDVQYPLRAQFMAVCIGMLFIKDVHRVLFLLKRKLDMKEVLGVASMMAAIYCCFALLATGLDKTDRWGGWWATVEIGAGDYLSFAMFIFGWWLSTYAELQRFWWKADPANSGHCYTGGLWAHATHINYFGESVMLTGLTMLTATWWMAWFPLGIIYSFIVGHIPALDEYLADRYGQEFIDYAAKTKKFCPFVY